MSAVTQSRSLPARALAIIVTPAAEWQRISAEENSSSVILMRYGLPLSLIWPVSASLGAMRYGRIAYGFGAYSGLAAPSGTQLIINGMYCTLLSLVSLMALGTFIDMLAPRFGGTRNSDRSFALAAYSATPVFLVGIVALIPSLAWLSVLGLWGIALLSIGAPVMMDIPRERRTGFVLAIVALALVMNLAISLLLQFNTRTVVEMGLA